MPVIGTFQVVKDGYAGTIRTLTQLPCGVLLDRYGPRLIDSTLLLVAAAGSLLFALADGVATLLVGRALIGLGVAVG